MRLSVKIYKIDKNTGRILENATKSWIFRKFLRKILQKPDILCYNINQSLTL